MKALRTKKKWITDFKEAEALTELGQISAAQTPLEELRARARSRRSASLPTNRGLRLKGI